MSHFAQQTRGTAELHSLLHKFRATRIHSYKAGNPDEQNYCNWELTGLQQEASVTVPNKSTRITGSSVEQVQVKINPKLPAIFTAKESIGKLLHKEELQWVNYSVVVRNIRLKTLTSEIGLLNRMKKYTENYSIENYSDLFQDGSIPRPRVYSRQRVKWKGSGGCTSLRNESDTSATSYWVSKSM